MFVVPDFMAPAFSCVMARRWRRGDGVAARGVPTPPVRRRGDGVAASVGTPSQSEGNPDAALIPITASDGRHRLRCAPRQSAASSTQTPASRLDAWTQWPSSASVVPGTARPFRRRCSGHVTTSSVCTAQAVAVVLSRSDAATIQPTAAANTGSTRALYLSCDGSLSGGGGAFVPDCRRSIIPRVYRCCFLLPPSCGPECQKQHWEEGGGSGSAGLLASTLVLEPKAAVFLQLLRHQGGL